MANMNWPTDYPKSIEVPPKQAKKLDCQLYRMVENNPPVSDDFLASYKDPKQKHLAKFSKFSNNPKFYGTSFFNNKKTVEAMLEESPDRFIGKKVAVGQVINNDGVAEISKTKHVTVWFFENTWPQGFKLI